MAPDDPFTIARSLGIPDDDLRRALADIEMACEGYKSWHRIDEGRDNLDEAAQLAGRLRFALSPDREWMRLKEDGFDLDAFLVELAKFGAAARQAHRSPHGRPATEQWMHSAATEVRALCKAARHRDSASCFSPASVAVAAVGPEARLLLAVLHRFDPTVLPATARTLARSVKQKKSGRKARPL